MNYAKIFVLLGTLGFLVTAEATIIKRWQGSSKKPEWISYSDTKTGWTVKYTPSLDFYSLTNSDPEKNEIKRKGTEGKLIFDELQRQYEQQILPYRQQRERLYEQLIKKEKQQSKK